MMTSRAEYRLLLRQDNADLRLTEIGRQVGLVSDERYAIFLDRKEKIEAELERLQNLQITGKKEVNDALMALGSTELKKPISLYELIKRPELDYFQVAFLDPDRPKLRLDIQEEVNIMSKYEGYIKKQFEAVSQFMKYESRKLDEIADYNDIKGLRIEAVQKLNKMKPLNLGQASRISGVNPADITVIQIYLERNKKRKDV